MGYLYTRYAAKNLPYVPIDELAKRYGGERHLRRFAPNVLALGQVDGVLVGMAHRFRIWMSGYQEPGKP